MQILRIVLILITLGCILGPIGTVVIIYRNNLSDMVVTPQLKQFFSNNNNSNNNGNYNSNNNGDDNNPNNNNNNLNNNQNNNNPSNNNPNNIFSSNNNTNNNNGDTSNGGNNEPTGLNAIFTGGQINTSHKTITLIFSVPNGYSQDQTLDSMSGTVEITEDQFQLGTVSLTDAPVTIHSGQAISVTVSGGLTSDGQDQLAKHYGGVTSLDITVVNGKMIVNGVNSPSSGPMDLGSINITS